MSDLLDETHAQQGLALLIANPNLAAVYQGSVVDPTPNPPYVVVYTRVAWPRDGIGTALDSVQKTITTTYTCHCVGLTESAARAVGMQVRSSLLNAKPVISGRSCTPIKQDDALDADRDDTTGRTVFDAIAIYSYISTG